MFVAFLLQIVFRYFFNFPVGWTSELTVATWLWLVLWGSAFVLKEEEEIRFDLIYRGRPRPPGRMGIVDALALVVLYGVSLKSSSTTRLQTGAIDGQDNPLPNVQNMKFYEVMTQIVLTSHLIGYDLLTVNLKTWNA